MKCKLTTQEKLKDLRNEKGLSLEELAKETGLSKSAIGSYESDDAKEITSSAIITLAKYYEVSTDYLLGFTDNREQHSSDIDSIGLDDDTVAELQSGNLNVRLICEMIKHPEFANFLSDLEIYVDNLAGMQIHNMNTFIEHASVDCQGNLNTFFCFLQIEMNSLEFLDFLLPYLFSHLELDTFNRVPAGTQQPAMQFC